MTKTENSALVEGFAEALRTLEARREVAQRKLEEAKREIDEVEQLLAEGRNFFNKVIKTTAGGGLPDDVAAVVNPNGRWTGVSVMDAIQQELEEIPSWKNLERRKLYEMVLARLREEQYPFKKRDDLAVNMALKHFLDKQVDEERKQVEIAQ